MFHMNDVDGTKGGLQELNEIMEGLGQQEGNPYELLLLL